MTASVRTCTPVSPIRDEAYDLITSQINFGKAYIGEARSAYESGNFEYGEVARKIALNAYSAAVRFSANLLQAPDPSLLRQIEDMESALDDLLEPAEAGIRSIA